MTYSKPSNQRQSSFSLIDQCLDIGLRMGKSGAAPTLQQLKRRYRLSQATAYRRRAQIDRFLLRVARRYRVQR